MKYIQYYILYNTIMSVSSNRILKIYKSRKTIIEHLSDGQGYNTDDYANFSINEIDAMYTNSQLDMLVSHKINNTKVYVKYYLSAKQIRPQNVMDIIEDLFVIDEVLTKNDTLVLIIDDEPNDTLISKIKYLYDHDGIFVVIHSIARLQFNILKHMYVPKMEILSEEKVNDLKKTYNLKSLEELPQIYRFDPQALAMCLRPGQVCELTRSSPTALETKYYRLCIQ